MPKGYWVAHVKVTDPEGYKKYIAANKAAFDKYGARYLARGGRAEDFGVGDEDRHVVIEFADYETAVTCYNSPEYQEALKFRKAASQGRTVIVEGVD